MTFRLHRPEHGQRHEGEDHGNAAHGKQKQVRHRFAPWLLSYLTRREARGFSVKVEMRTECGDGRGVGVPRRVTGEPANQGRPTSNTMRVLGYVVSQWGMIHHAHLR